jgi:hypothetical protein
MMPGYVSRAFGPGQTVLDRTTLTSEGDGVARQHIEISRDGGISWITTFDARYLRTAG